MRNISEIVEMVGGDIGGKEVKVRMLIEGNVQDCILMVDGRTDGKNKLLNDFNWGELEVGWAWPARK